jgi:thiol-disulfide isomerase/thioredoxin
MGRLSAVRALQRLPLVWLAALSSSAALISACNSGTDAPAKSRVQAVLTEEQAGGAPSAGSATSAGTVTPVAEPAPKPPARPRPPLCEGQLSAKPQPFKPRSLPAQRSAEPGAELPEDPLKATRGKWTWLNFWAAWCVPCKEELPILFGWQQQLGSRVAFTFVSMDDDERQLREFLEKQPATGLRQTQWLPDGAVRKAWLEALGLSSEPELPLQVLLDPKGMIRCRVEGAVEAKDLELLAAIVEPAKKK